MGPQAKLHWTFVAAMAGTFAAGRPALAATTRPAAAQSAAIRYDDCPLDPIRAALWKAGRTSPPIEQDAQARDSAAIREQIERVGESLAATDPTFHGRRRALARRLHDLRFRLLAMESTPGAADGNRLELAVNRLGAAWSPRVLPDARALQSAFGGRRLTVEDAIRIAEASSSRPATVVRAATTATDLAAVAVVMAMGTSPSQADGDMAAMLLATSPSRRPADAKSVGVDLEPILASFTRAEEAAGSNNAFLARPALAKAVRMARESWASLNISQRRDLAAAEGRVLAALGAAGGDGFEALPSLHDQGHYGNRDSLFAREARGIGSPADQRTIQPVPSVRGGGSGGSLSPNSFPNQLARRSVKPDKSPRSQ